MQEGTGRWRDLALRSASAAVLVPVALLCLWMGDWAWTALVALGAIGLGLEWRAMCRRRPMPYPGLAGAAYILPAAAAMLWLRTEGLGNVLFLLCVVWASDIGAYLVGRFIGGAKLAPAISPGKTRSGAVGGLAAALLVGAIAANLGGGELTDVMAVAALLGVVAQAGDLLESAAKRYFGVKDSGRTIPGHGGLFDRLDAVLLAAPVGAVLVLWRGVELWQ